MENERNDLIAMVERQELAAKDFGFYWENLEQIIQQIHSECAEIAEAWHDRDPLHLQEEVGDLLQAAISLSVFCGLDTHATLQKSIHKFQKRYDVMITLAKQDGHETLHKLSAKTLLEYWELAKKV